MQLVIYVTFKFEKKIEIQLQIRKNINLFNQLHKKIVAQS